MTKMEKIQNSSSDKDLTFFNISFTFGHISIECELGGSEYRRFKLKSFSGIYDTGTIFMYDLMPRVNTCIVIDSDTLFGVEGTSRQRSGKGAIRKKIPTPKTEVGKNQTNNQVLIQ